MPFTRSETAGVLARRQGSIRATAARKQVLARLAARGAKIVVQSLARQLGELEADGPVGLPLSYGRSIDSVAVGRHIVDAQSEEITAPQLAVDGRIEHRQVARALLKLQLGAYRPNMSWPQRRLWTREFALTPGRPTRPYDL